MIVGEIHGLIVGEIHGLITAGFGCMVGKGSGCESAPLLAPGYVLCNLGFNISLLNLLRASTSVIQSLTLSSLVGLLADFLIHASPVQMQHTLVRQESITCISGVYA